MIFAAVQAIAPILDRVDFAAIRFGLTHDGDPIRAFEMASERGAVVKIPPDQVIISDPVVATEILTDGKRFPRDRGTELFRKVLGPGALTADLPDWTRMRQLIHPVMQGAIHKRDAVIQEAELVCSRWDERNVLAGKPIDVYPEMARFTLSVMGTTLFGLRLDPYLDALLAAVKVLERQFIYLATEEQFETLMPRFEQELRDARTIRVPNFGPATFLFDVFQDVVHDLTVESTLVGVEGLHSWMTRGLDQKSVDIAVEILDCTAHSMINEARAGHLLNEENILSRLLEEQQRSSLTDTDIRNQVLNLLLAGSGTTATTLATLLYYVLAHAAFIPLLREEAAAAVEACGSLESEEFDGRLTLSTALVYETLRLFPATRQVARTATEPMELGGVQIEPRDLLVANILGIHRRRSLWPEWSDPRAFEPSHWIGVAPEARPAFMPFGVGPHRCPGRQHAILYARILLAVILRRYDLEFAEANAQLSLTPGSTVQIGPLFVNVKPRAGPLAGFDA